MGRPRGFDEDIILEAAAGAFARGGYEGTSIDDLVRTLGLHSGSLHQARGQLTVERADVDAGVVVTVLRFAGAPTRRGRVVLVSWLRSMFTPDDPGGVADAWLDALYPPGAHPDSVRLTASYETHLPRHRSPIAD